MKTHPAADLFPMLAQPDLEALAENVRAHGLLHPIVTLGGQILDGRHRFLACAMAKVKPRFEKYGGKDPLGYVVAANLARRHLDASQRAMVGARLKPLYEAEAKEREHARKTRTMANLPESSSRDQAAAAVNVSSRGVASAAKVLADGATAVIAAVDAGEIAVSDAAKVVGLPKAEQRAAVKAVLAGEASTVARAAGVEDAPPDYSEADEAADHAADFEAMSKIIGADDKLAAAFAEIKAAGARYATLSALYDGMGREVAGLKREASRWLRKAKKSAKCVACRAALEAE